MPSLARRLPQRSMEAHRKGKESAAAARAAAEAAGEDQAAQEQAAKEAFDREDDRTPEERQTFKQACGLCRRSIEPHGLPLQPRLFAKGSRLTALAASQGLLAVNLWYGHPLTSVLLVDTPLPEGEWTNLQPYGGRGWCRMEQRASAMVKNAAGLISLSALTGDEEDWSSKDWMLALAALVACFSSFLQICFELAEVTSAPAEYFTDFTNINDWVSCCFVFYVVYTGVSSGSPSR